MSKKSKNKTPKYLADVNDRKEPKAQALLLETNKIVAYRFSILDTDGPFGWHTCDSHHHYFESFKKLGHFEGRTWAQMGDAKSHAVPVADLSKEAQKRLRELKQDDVDELYSVRLTGPKRIWGIRDGGILKVLWWDPKHQVCPSELKHT